MFRLLLIAFSSSKPAKIPAPVIVPPMEELPPPVEEPQPLVKAAAEKEVEKMKKKRGAQSTILTGPEGLTGEAPVQKKKLGD